MFVLKYFVQGRFVAEIRAGAYFRDEASYATTVGLQMHLMTTRH